MVVKPETDETVPAPVVPGPPVDMETPVDPGWLEPAPETVEVPASPVVEAVTPVTPDVLGAALVEGTVTPVLNTVPDTNVVLACVTVTRVGRGTVAVPTEVDGGSVGTTAVGVVPKNDMKVSECFHCQSEL